VHFPVKMDNGDVDIFTGYRVQHNNARGPYKGWFARYHRRDIDIGCSTALSVWMLGKPHWQACLLGAKEYSTRSYKYQLGFRAITRRFYVLPSADNIGQK